MTAGFQLDKPACLLAAGLLCPLPTTMVVKLHCMYCIHVTQLHCMHASTNIMLAGPSFHPHRQVLP
jgi:hypothetical protein